ncbi:MULTISPECIES: hypothetical protein [unclassified Mesorhizobium]|uniref:hypothetical protein n=2 Tax=Mesorhizobium TaxID=68287 RepID=UPI000FC9AC2C|nr:MULTISPECIES: hypothetical protein [unclassified Mesorhizobium]RUW78311.1 hypothetical protein EOA31_01850 [Mesorhizobium sp. M4B.F.Ca.ET.049.02.1.2]TGV28518.1 hypothetical protein EN786_01990 [Mesorhizobium sp. M4B.F.Ca.ET.143.01.1.1]
MFSYRYDAHLVPGLIANLDPIVDGWIAYDDRGSDAVFSSEPARRRALLSAAFEAGADWILAMDPDERLENAVADQIGQLTSRSRRIAWGFRTLEMYTPDSYRVDGPWGQKMQHRLFSAYHPDRYRSTDLHGAWFHEDLRLKLRDSGLNLYHLKMIEPKRRAARRDLYNHLDPDRRLQDIGYDYLADDSGAVFETIPPGRGYFPVHSDDGGLWMADVSDIRPA